MQIHLLQSPTSFRHFLTPHDFVVDVNHHYADEAMLRRKNVSTSATATKLLQSHAFSHEDDKSNFIQAPTLLAFATIPTSLLLSATPFEGSTLDFPILDLLLPCARILNLKTFPSKHDTGAFR